MPNKLTSRLARLIGPGIARARQDGRAHATRLKTVAVALVGVAAVGAAQMLLGPDVALSIFYIVPICFAVLYAGAGLGLLAAVIASAAWIAALALAPEPVEVGWLAWNGSVRFALFAFVVFLLDALIGRIRQLDESQAALRASEERYRALFERASDGVFVADLDGRYTEVNDAGCRMLGYACSEIVGKRIVDLIPPEEVERLEQSKREMLAGGEDRTEWRLRHKDGHYVPIEISAQILPDGRWVALVRDITERKRAQQAAEAAAAELEARVAERTAQLRTLAAELAAAEDRERRQIARDLHDDLGQTLAVARIKLAGLQAADAAGQAAVRDVDGLIERADRATRSLAAQLAPPVLYELGLVPALEWLADELRDTYGLEVEVTDDGEPKPLAQAARAILYRAVRELLINVAKHAGVDSASVETARLDGRLLVRVHDSGKGFDHEALVRAPRRGLGLASVRERLSYVGGSVDVRSVPGDGTIVELAAPLADALEAQELAR